jgi:hypothetical protein
MVFGSQGAVTDCGHDDGIIQQTGVNEVTPFWFIHIVRRHRFTGGIKHFQ